MDKKDKSGWKEGSREAIVSFFNELDTKKNYAQGSGFNPQIFASFFNEIATEKKNMLKAYVSFFNEIATKNKNCARGLSLIMASKRITLWQDTMSRDKTRSWLPRDIH
jgi:hypothetical protein